MNTFEIQEIGEIIRKVRKEKGLRLEDLADENISPATISNIERGIPHVNPQRATYLLEKLDIRLEDIPHLIIQEQEALHELTFQLFMIETMRDAGNIDDALQQLKTLQLDDSHPYAANIYFLTGTCFNQLQQLEKAQRCLFDAIRLSSQSPYGKKSNIEAASFYVLGMISSQNHQTEQALDYIESGLGAFKEGEEKKHLKVKLIEKKVGFLEKLGRVGEALKLIEDYWDPMLMSHDINVILGFYGWRAELLSRLRQFDLAANYCNEGISIARINGHPHQLFTLWNRLADIHHRNMDATKAEDCYQIALSIKSKKIQPSDIARTQLNLSTLYMKQQRFKESYHVINEALFLFKQMNEIPGLVDTLILLGKYHGIQDDQQTAISYLQEALTISDQYKLTDKKVNILFLLAQCWEFIDKQEFHSCLTTMYQVKYKGVSE
ncbi:helix-turn-helix domain-containing protein [Marininema halotolerans]|nr:helix-turn-helix domain-containing protein [Marininema halotolerans]